MDGDTTIDEGRFLGVRETARLLDVHENTVRNWARQGVLRTARVPGSRYHRFDAHEVERIRAQRGAPVSSVARERRTIGPELLDATQLSHWAETRDAQDRFPELVRRLLASTPGISDLSMRSGDGVSAPGWDGRAKSAGTSYLPSGSLRIEIGVGGRPKSKADTDYEKRSNAMGAASSEVVFVFITPRRWSGAEEWAAARRRERIFTDVCVLDADDVEGWLQAAPAVHHWISEHVGHRPRDAQTLEQWWSRFSERTRPPLPAELFVAGRTAERDQVCAFLQSPPDVITVQAPWGDEALAFVWATLAYLGRDNARFDLLPLTVRSPEAWDSVISQPAGMVLIPLYDAPDIAAAVDGGHHVILTIGQEQIARGTKIELPRPHRRLATEALEAADVSPDLAYELSGLARRNMRAMIRKLARDNRVSRPPWTQLPDAKIFAPLALVGAWTPSTRDIAAVCQIADGSWPEIERNLLDWTTRDDGPFVQAGTQWHLASPDEAFLVLRDVISPADLKRWHQAAVEVLTETNPVLDLSQEDRPSAGLLGIVSEHSEVLRRGLAQGIALVGADNRPLSDGMRGADHAHEVVRAILDHANSDASGRIWCSLSDVLPLLAEAAPQVCLDAMHADLDRGKPVLATMFQDRERTSWPSVSSPHTGLLWALETLCWTSEHLVEATQALARLEEIDPGGSLSNRPLSSLTSVLVGWIRHTAAPADVRLAAIEAIGAHQPDVAWRLVLELWPTNRGVVKPPHSPRFRDWKPDARGVSIAEWIALIGELVALAARLADTDADRWTELVGYLGPLPPAARDDLLAKLEAFSDPGSMDSTERISLWERLQTEVNRHRRFATAQWSMDDGPLARMQALADRLEPTSSVERHGYLFDWHPDLTGMGLYDHDEYEQRLLELRASAVTEAFAQAGSAGLERLARRSPVPGHLGGVIGKILGDAVAPEFLRWLDSEDHRLADVAACWAKYQLWENGVPWLRACMDHPSVQQQSRREVLAHNSPSTAATWDALKDIDPDLSDTYWSCVGGWGISAEDAERATNELLAHQRPWTAIDLLAAQVHGREEPPASMTPVLIRSVLDAALHSEAASSQSQVPGYEIGMLLDYLATLGSEAAVLAGYEFAFFGLLDDHRKPTALYAALASDPTLFVELLRRVYRGKNEAKRGLAAHEEALARHAWRVLREWNNPLPGQRVDGTFDGAQMKSWVDEARAALAECDRSDIGDEQIGQVLGRTTAGTDGIWPAEPVRAIIETIGSESLASGMHVGAINQRGVTWRDPFDGGVQERALACTYRDWAKQTAAGWRRTSRLLRGIAESYERSARREDEQAEILADTE